MLTNLLLTQLQVLKEKKLQRRNQHLLKDASAAALIRIQTIQMWLVQLNQPHPFLHILLRSTDATFLLFNTAQTTESKSQDPRKTNTSTLSTGLNSSSESWQENQWKLIKGSCSVNGALIWIMSKDAVWSYKVPGVHCAILWGFSWAYAWGKLFTVRILK